MQIIVPYDSRDDEIALLVSRFPQVTFHRVTGLRSPVGDKAASREHHDELRGIGLRLAEAPIIALIEDHGRVDPHWAEKVLEAHKNTYAAVGGAIENEVDRPLNWAVYFCDFGRYQRPFVAAPSFYVSDANLSYKRRALENIKEVWQDSFHETSVNASLAAAHQTLWLSPDIVIYQHRENLKLSTALQERYVWGRSFAGTRARNIPTGKRIIFLALSPALSFVLIARKIQIILLKKRLIAKFTKAFPLTALLTLVWSFGEFVGYLTARPSAYIQEELRSTS
jgi:hypothetical protein